MGNPAAPHPDMLEAIKRFGRLALIFLVVGLVSEFVLARGAETIRALAQLVFQSQLVRVRFAKWEFSPQAKIFAFSFGEDRINTDQYVLPAFKNRYRVIVGVRAKTNVPPDQGSYNLIFGPFHIANQERTDKVLSQEELQSFGDCVEFTAFGIERPVDDQIPVPFYPNKETSLVLFNTASACERRV
jgi:hypothetical protein